MKYSECCYCELQIGGTVLARGEDAEGHRNASNRKGKLNQGDEENVRNNSKGDDGDTNETASDDTSDVFVSPNGTSLWVPNVAGDLIPIVGAVFRNLDDAYVMYQSYALASGFTVRVGQQKKYNRVVTHKYFRCNRSGKPQPKTKFDASTECRQSTFICNNCKAHICFKFSKQTSCLSVLKFVEGHNHSLVEGFNKDLTKICRKLPFVTKKYIHDMSQNRIGAVKAHRLMVSMKGGHHNVNGTPMDFKKFSKATRMYIGDRDTQLVINRLQERLKSLPNFYFDYLVDEGKLRSIFWADEISKVNYEAFGDVLAFDATYQTNKYNMIFIPFTSVDNHRHYVTFGAGLIFSCVTSVASIPPSIVHVAHHEETTIKNFSQVNPDNGLLSTYEVKYDTVEKMAECSCRCFSRIGYLCRHVFCAFQVNRLNQIPQTYISKRWTKNALPRSIYRVENRYGVYTSVESGLRREVLELMNDCVDDLRAGKVGLENLVEKMRELKRCIRGDLGQSTIVDNSNEGVVQEFVGQEMNVEVSVNNPGEIRTKGCGKRRRVSGLGEKVREKPLKNRRLIQEQKHCNQLNYGRLPRASSDLSQQSARNWRPSSDSTIKYSLEPITSTIKHRQNMIGKMSLLIWGNDNFKRTEMEMCDDERK
ncbi:hypothetical protein SSX86_010101 [Deinandra increscens subsp. villosa]|uniref:SWIM-type domain-containing protein n=1 Tax=Deinandra increscens subsp. villosa TaxID=3103831 RepID=A0AAP0H4N4_9ASTR